MGEEAEEEEEESAATKRPIPFRLLLKSYGPDPTSSEALRPTAAAWGRSETHKLGGRTARRRTTKMETERGVVGGGPRGMVHTRGHCPSPTTLPCYSPHPGEELGGDRQTDPDARRSDFPRRALQDEARTRTIRG
ncbi:unnamed protein product [Prorocentrum cordatum]|uniref:Uncharacterized protein n=1 Tax=Prorocentrum cordatum TaxID=2364126 RepID=A0ABN9WPB2_9DINO|nr:unnamed protein product [Polarella glacialis]